MPRFPLRAHLASILTIGLLTSVATGGVFLPISAEAAGTSSIQTPVPAGCEGYQGSFLDTTAKGMLKRLGVSFYSGDTITAFPDPALGIGAFVTLCREPEYTIIDAGVSNTQHSWTHTVQAYLTEQRVQVGDNDEVTPSADTVLKTGDTITIVRVAQSQVVVSVPLDFAIQYQDDPTQIVGTQKVKQVGQTGIRKDTYQNVYKNNALFSHTKVSSQVTKQPVPQIIAKGTKPKVAYLSSGQYMTYLNEAAAQYSVPADKLQAVMNCESGGNINSSGGGGMYKGLFQFDASTWAHTDYASRSILDPEAQILAAASLWAYRAEKWPICSRGTL